MEIATRPTSPVEVDASDIARFADVVFGYLEGFVPVRAFAEKGTQDRPPLLRFTDPPNLASLLQELAPDAAQNGQGLFVVPATVAAPGRARAEDIIQTAVLLVDVDGGEIDETCAYLSRHIGKPSLEIASGGVTNTGEAKRHLYWKLTEPAIGDDLNRVRAVREMIARKANGDLAFRSLHQPIRVPGSIHCKCGIPAKVRILRDTSIEYELDDLERAVTDMPSLPGADAWPGRSQGPHLPTVEGLATLPVREGCADGISRFEALSKTMGYWIRLQRLGRCSPETAWSAVQEYNAALIRPPWPEDRLRREFLALLQLDSRNHGLDHPRMGEARIAAPERSEDAIAFEFVQRHGRDWRHVAAWNSWFGWKDGKWHRDDVGRVRELMRQVCREVALTTDKPNEARRISSEKTIAASVRIAASDERVALPTSAWDAHPMLLNTPSGIVDLEMGELKRHERDLLITQMTTASPGGQCPRWMQFLDEITGNDAELKGYLARLAGYILTGSTAEQMFAFLYGSGANGKSVFVSVLSAILGDYAATAAIETFMAARGDRHLTELAGLRAARLVIVPETDQGRAWAEGRIKTVTGGEKIRANFMRQDHFEFQPQLKLVVAGNHRPALSGVGEAMRRRLHLVPFEVTIPPERRDPKLIEKLLEERDGILAWMIEGCAEWQRIGLSPPKAIQLAGNEYFEEEDVVGQWLEECCEVGEGLSATARLLYQCWSVWAERAGYPTGTQKALGTALRERGFASGKIGGARSWLGLRPRHAAPTGEGEP